MNEREKQIAEAAVRVFARYGIKRATMADIAEEAGVVRQTLYNIFANKAEVINGTVLYYMQVQREKTEAAWTEASTLSEKLDALFEYNVFEPWDHIAALPDASEIEQGDHAAGKVAIETAGAEMRSSIEKLLQPYVTGLNAHGHTPLSMANFLQSTMMSLKHETSERTTLESLISTLKTMVLQASKDDK